MWSSPWVARRCCLEGVHPGASNAPHPDRRRTPAVPANDVFLRIAGYTQAEVLGRPHNLIRHPDMPQAVFKLLWDTLAAEQEIFAYVVNLAGDGAHYWVFAHVTPTYNRAGQVTGYHSNRRAPDQRAIDAVVPLYAQMRPQARRQRPRPVLRRGDRHPRSRSAGGDGFGGDPRAALQALTRLYDDAARGGLESRFHR